MKLYNFCFYAAIFLLFPTPGIAAERIFSLGGITIVLGSPKETLRKQLEPRFIVKEIEDSFYVQERKPNGTYELLGFVRFRDGRVSSVSRSLGNFHGKEGTELGNELRSALERLQSATQSVIVVNLKERRSAPGTRITPIEFSSDGRWVALTIFEGKEVDEKGGPVIDLSEGIASN